MEETSQSQDSMGGCLLYLFWTLVGPGLLLALAAYQLLNRPEVGSPSDFVFGGLVLAVVLARLLSRQKGAPPDAGGTDPAQTSRIKYVVGVLVISAAIYVIGHFVLPKGSP